MTPGNAMKILKGLYPDLSRAGKAAIDAAVEALEKQIPKKPTQTGEQHIRYSMNYVCPLCGNHFSGTGIASYCYHCGQALDWNDNITEKGI